MTHTPQPPAGWYPDPAGSDGERFWDGVAWSQATRDKPAPPPPAESMAPPQQTYGAPPQSYPQQDGHQGQQHGYQQPMSHQQHPGTYTYNYGPGPTAGPIVRIAAFGWRLLGYLIDSVLITIVGWIVASAFGITGQMLAVFDRWTRDLTMWADNPVGDPPPLPDAVIALNTQLTVVMFVLFAVYRTVMVGAVGATLGQLAVGLRVVKVGDGPEAKLGWGAAIVRGVLGAFAYVLWYVTLPSGICLLVNRNRQSLQDLIARTYVLKVR